MRPRVLSLGLVAITSTFIALPTQADEASPAAATSTHCDSPTHSQDASTTRARATRPYGTSEPRATSPDSTTAQASAQTKLSATKPAENGNLDPDGRRGALHAPATTAQSAENGNLNPDGRRGALHAPATTAQPAENGNLNPDGRRGALHAPATTEQSAENGNLNPDGRRGALHAPATTAQPVPSVPAVQPVPSVPAVPTAKTTPTFRVSKGVSHALQKYSGMTWLTNATISGIATTALSLKSGSLVHAKIRTYGFTDLLDGEFKSVEVKTNNGKVHGVPFGKVRIATDTPFKFRYFQRKGHNSGLRTPVLFNIDGDLGEDDVSRALKTPAVSDGLRFLKLDLPGLGEQRLQVLQPKVDLRGNKIILDSFLVTAGAPLETGIPLHVVATPVLEQDRLIILKNMEIESKEIEDPKNFAHFADELLNPLINFGRMDRFTRAFRMSKLNIENNRVNYSGRLLLAPKQTSTPTFSAPFIMNTDQVNKAAQNNASARH